MRERPRESLSELKVSKHVGSFGSADPVVDDVGR